MKLTFARVLKKLDTFGVGMKFLIDGDETYKTKMGAIASSICFTLVAAYTMYLVWGMLSFSDTNFSSSTVKNFYSQSDFYYPVNN